VTMVDFRGIFAILIDLRYVTIIYWGVFVFLTVSESYVFYIS